MISPVMMEVERWCAWAICSSLSPEGGLCMVADVTEQGEQFAVQFPVADAQAVGVILHVAYPLRLQGDKLFVQRAELVGRGGHLHRFLAAEPSGYAFLLLHDGTGLCRLPCSFWQMVHQQEIGRAHV